MAYESGRNRLLTAEVKAFIVPDTVEEVIQANEKLEEGLLQIERIKHWLAGKDLGTWVTALGLPLDQTTHDVHFAVIGNGFAGSDDLPIPEGIAVVDARWLLLERFRRASVIEAIELYQRRLVEEASRALADLSFNAVTLAGVTFQMPSWVVDY